jgi:hypothetical protein
MFHRVGCDLVRGVIEADHVCDRWKHSAVSRWLGVRGPGPDGQRDDTTVVTANAVGDDYGDSGSGGFIPPRADLVAGRPGVPVSQTRNLAQAVSVYAP